MTGVHGHFPAQCVRSVEIIRESLGIVGFTAIGTKIFRIARPVGCGKGRIENKATPNHRQCMYESHGICSDSLPCRVVCSKSKGKKQLTPLPAPPQKVFWRDEKTAK